MIEQPLKDWLNKPLGNIKRDMVDGMHARLGKDHPALANQCMRVLRSIFNDAMDRDSTLTENPVRIKKSQWFPDRQRTRRVEKNAMPDFHAKVIRLQSVIARTISVSFSTPAADVRRSPMLASPG